MKRQIFAFYRMAKFQIRRMQGNPPEFYSKIPGKGKAPFAYQRMTYLLKMYPYLIGPAGNRYNLNNRKALFNFQQSIFGNSIFCFFSLVILNIPGYCASSTF